MKTNKALIKHETRNMKWMSFYFLLISISGVLLFNASLNAKYMEILSGDLVSDESVIILAISTVLNSIMVAIGIGILLMIYLQFKDSKSIEVGNFLKVLPISNKEYYITKLVGGLIALTIPTIILIVGVLIIRSNNMIWISDIHSISFFPELIIKSDSVVNLTSILIMSYLVAVSTYVFLFMMQYILTNIVSGLIIGMFVWLSPIFLLGSLSAIYGGFFTRVSGFNVSLIKWQEVLLNYIQPWIYPSHLSSFNTGESFEYNPILDNIQFMYYKGIPFKIIIMLIITVVSIAIGYVLSKKSRVEDSDAFISFKWAKRLFVIGVTTCSAFLLADIGQMFFSGFGSFGSFNSLSFIMISLIMLIGGIIGFIISRKIITVNNK